MHPSGVAVSNDREIPQRGYRVVHNRVAGENLTFAWRVARLFAKLLVGLWISATSFARADSPQRHAIIRSWSRDLLHWRVSKCAQSTVRTMPSDPVTLVANHVSWADIFALNTQRACHFIAKAELRRWPLCRSPAGERRPCSSIAANARRRTG